MHGADGCALHHVHLRDAEITDVKLAVIREAEAARPRLEVRRYLRRRRVDQLAAVRSVLRQLEVRRRRLRLPARVRRRIELDAPFDHARGETAGRLSEQGLSIDHVELALFRHRHHELAATAGAVLVREIRRAFAIRHRVGVLRVRLRRIRIVARYGDGAVGRWGLDHHDHVAGRGRERAGGERREIARRLARVRRADTRRRDRGNARFSRRRQADEARCTAGGARDGTRAAREPQKRVARHRGIGVDDLGVHDVDDRELVRRDLGDERESHAQRRHVVEIGALVASKPVVHIVERRPALADERDLGTVLQRPQVHRDALLVAAVKAEDASENAETRYRCPNESPHHHLEALGATGDSIMAIITP